MNRWLGSLLIMAVVGPATTRALPAAADGPDVVISEFMASNTNTLLVGGAAPDWIELWNRGTAAADMSGWHLTDTAANLVKWTFPAGTTLPVDGRLLVYADSAPTTAPPLHTNFGLSAGGEYLALTGTSGAIVSEYAPSFPAQTANISFGLGTNAITGFLLTPTPGTANSAAATGFATKPTVSRPGGWFTGMVEVTLATTTPSGTIVFTTDGSTPTATHGTTYTAALQIASTTILRAVTVREGWFDSRLASATYLVLDEVLAQEGTPTGWPTGPVNGQVFDYGLLQTMVATEHDALAAAMAATPTLSVITDQGNLTDPTTGIYTNPGGDGSAWERPVSLELIEADGAPGFQINAGIRIKGNFSRRPDNPKHSFRLKFGSQYEGLLTYDVFGAPVQAGVTDRFTEIDLRSEQNWSWQEGSPYQTFLREVWERDSQAAAGDPSTRSRWVHLFLNGQYWGLYMLKDRPTAGYATSLWGGSVADYDVIKHADDFGYETQDGDDDEWRSLWAAIADGKVSDSEFAMINTEVDLRNLVDFQVLHAVAGNLDATPDYNQGDRTGNNWYAVRGNGEPFRFFVDDAEHTMGARFRNSTYDRTGPFPITVANNRWREHFFNPGWLHQVLLVTRAEYRILMRDRVHLLLSDSGALDTANSTARWAARQAEVDPLVIAEAARWGDSSGTAFTRATWSAEVQWVIDNWLPVRTNIVRAQLEADTWWVAGIGTADAGYAPAVRVGAG